MMMEVIVSVAAGGFLFAFVQAHREAQAQSVALADERAAHAATRRTLYEESMKRSSFEGELKVLRTVTAPVDVSYVDPSTGKQFTADELAKVERGMEQDRERYEKEMDELMGAGVR